MVVIGMELGWRGRCERPFEGEGRSGGGVSDVGRASKQRDKVTLELERARRETRLGGVGGGAGGGARSVSDGQLQLLAPIGRSC